MVDKTLPVQGHDLDSTTNLAEKAPEPSMTDFYIEPISALNLPLSINNYAKLSRGLVLVTGSFNSGKSTTVSAILDEINRTQNGRILTVEDPIRLPHTNKKCVVNQYELSSGYGEEFSDTLMDAIHEVAPDYIFVGELMNREIVRFAITMAEKGHLVFGIFATNSAPETISRIIDLFPAYQQEQVKTQLADSLQAVVCQKLVRTADGNGRVPVVEIMNTTQSVKSKIKKGDFDSLVSDLQNGESYGMQTMDSNLLRLAKEGVIDIETAVENARRPRDMMTEFGGEEAYYRMVEAKSNE